MTNVRVAFFDWPFWAVGALNKAVIARLDPGSIMLNWNEAHDITNMQKLVSDGYLFCTSGPGVWTLIHTYNIPVNRICVMSHDEDDWANMTRALGNDTDRVLSQLHGFAVPSVHLVSGILGRGISRIPQCVPYGLSVADWTFRPRTTIQTIGVCGALSRPANTGHADCKRGRLVYEVGQQAHKIVRHTGGQVPDVNAWYQDIDLNMTAGVFEGGPLSPFEAGACGIPTLGTNTGSWTALAQAKSGIALPINNRDYIKTAVATIAYYDKNPQAYEELSHAVRLCVSSYDWRHIMPAWRDWFEFPAQDFM